MKAKILSMLREEKESISGQQLCEQFGVSRTAIWKVIKQLKEEGYEIESISNKGYRLMKTPDILSVSEIKSQLNTDILGRNCYYYKEIDSTNLQAKLAGEQGEAHGTLFVADAQTKGRGRRGRHWESPEGGNLYFSLLLRPEFSPNQASMITLLMAVAVTRTMRELSRVDVSIKWPNDLVISGKKVCGILTEMSAEVDGIHYIVVGTGINVTRSSYLEEVEELCTSLEKEQAIFVLRAALLQQIMIEFEQLYDAFCETTTLEFIKTEYEQYLVNVNKKVKVLDAVNEFVGTAKGITSQGELIVVDEVGKEHLVSSGEVSVRGLYGYV